MTEGTEIQGFWANYCDWKLIKTRGFVQVVFEVPLHMADHAYKILGGMPDYSKERPFVIAALDLAVVDSPDHALANDGASQAPRGWVSERAHPRKSVAPEKMLAQQAGMACADPRFQLFMDASGEEETAVAVRNHCYVVTRAEIVPGSEAGDRWEELYQEFLVWRTDQDMGAA